MSKQHIYRQIRDTVDNCLPGTRILLFGSHARGDFNRHSDYDLLIITRENYTAKQKVSWLGQLNKLLVTAINAPVDLLMNSEAEIAEKEQIPGHIIGSALKEGVAL